MSMTALASILLAVGTVEPATEWALEEFTNYTARIFGAVPKAAFVLPGETEDFAEDFAALKDTDGYAVRKRGDTLYFIADCARGHVNGVHRWLEKNSDVIWPRPKGDLCFFTPKHGASAPECATDYRDIPAFKMRLFGGGSDDETRRYLVRNACTPANNVNRFKGGRADRDAAIRVSSEARYGIIGTFNDVYGSGHDMCRRWFPKEEFFKDHPEWWMLNGGERVCPKETNFCETNPDFVRAYCRSVEKKIRDVPTSVKILSICMEDTTRTCECANCLKPIVLSDGGTVGPDDPAFKSTRFFIFFNEVARHVAKIRPDLKIMQFAYQHLLIPPKVPVEPNLIIKFCPFPRDMRQSVAEGPSNRTIRAAMDGWLKLTPDLFLREYYFCQCIYYPRPIGDSAAVDLRFCRNRGVPYASCDSPGGGGDSTRINREYSLFREYREFYDMNAMEAWVVQKLFWDPSQDPETLRMEFLTRTFGPAADEMKACWKILREAWYSDRHPSTYHDDPIASAVHYIAEKGLTERVRGHLDRAAVKADLPARKDWLVKMRTVLDDWLESATGAATATLTVPRVAGRADVDVGFDFFSPTWQQAKGLLILRKPVETRTVDCSGTRAWMLADKASFCVAVDVCKPDGLKVIADKNLPTGAYPRHDRVVLSFDGGRGGGCTFAVDPFNHRFAAHGLTDVTVGDWTSRTSCAATGWKAVLRIPFSTLGINPEMFGELRFNLAVGTAESGGDSLGWVFSLGGGRPFAPSTWNRLALKQFHVKK